jgi:hypothetical protein
MTSKTITVALTLCLLSSAVAQGQCPSLRSSHLRPTHIYTPATTKWKIAATRARATKKNLEDCNFSAGVGADVCGAKSTGQPGGLLHSISAPR